MLTKVANINDLKQGTKLVKFNDCNPSFWEYLMPHPHNEKYVLLLDEITKDAKKVYNQEILGEYGFSMWYTYNSIDEVEEKALELLKDKVERFEKRVKEHK